MCLLKPQIHVCDGDVHLSVTHEEITPHFYLNVFQPRPHSLQALTQKGVLPDLLIISPLKTSYRALQDTPRVKTWFPQRLFLRCWWCYVLCQCALNMNRFIPCRVLWMLRISHLVIRIKTKQKQQQQQKKKCSQSSSMKVGMLKAIYENTVKTW